MDNETPNYASWIPAAGGYVANGKVVSKSPLYDEAGKLRLDVDTSVFGNTQTPTTTQTSTAQPQRLASQAETTRQNLQNIINAQSPETQKALTGSIFGDMATANKEGSGVDANPLATGVGSLGSLNNNTENTEYGPTNTPATHSNIAGEPILTPVQQAEQELQRAIASGNDFQRMINAYTRLQNLTGVDYSAEIKNVMRQGQQSVENVDNDYSSRIATAMMRGDTEEVGRLRNEQAIWRNTVGYQDAMTQKYQMAREELNVDYETTYMEGVKDITGMLMQALPGILNFQYNPATDPALQVAQGYAVSRVKEQMNATGMYYSSMTQNAITKAVAELVPVYQKMAKEEAIQNFQLLQQTANFLVNLEETQFNLWKGQLDMKFKANAEKRAEIEAAWDKVNQLGYVDNETSAILGIPAGTESYTTRKMYVDKLNQIDAEERNLQQNKALERYQTDLALEKMGRQAELALDEYRQKSGINLEEYEKKSGIDLKEYEKKSGIDLKTYEEKAKIDQRYPSGTSGTSGGSNTKTKIVKNPDGSYSVTEETTLDRPLTEKEQQEIDAANQVANEGDYHGTQKAADLKTAVSTKSDVTTKDKLNKLLYIKEEALNESEAKKAVGEATDKNGEKLFDEDIFTESGIDGLIMYYRALDDDYFAEPIEGTDGTKLDAYKSEYGDDVVSENNIGLVYLLSENSDKIPVQKKRSMITKYLDNAIQNELDSETFGGNASDTRKKQLRLQELIEDYAVPLMDSNLTPNGGPDQVANMYNKLIDKIVETPNYDISLGWFDQGKKGMAQGIQNIIINIRDTHQNDSKWNVALKKIREHADELSKDGKINDWDKIKMDYNGGDYKKK